jgi:hypothetical protein
MYRRLIATIFILMFLGSFARSQNEREKVRFCFIGAGDLGDASAPRFDQYSVKASPPSSPAKLDLHSSPIARMYRRHTPRDESRRELRRPLPGRDLGLW